MQTFALAVMAKGLFAVSALCTVLDIARSTIVERLPRSPHKPLGRPPQPDGDLVAAIKAVIVDVPTYGYRRIHATLYRKALAAGEPRPNHKRAYCVMKAYSLLSGATPVIPMLGAAHRPSASVILHRIGLTE